MFSLCSSTTNLHLLPPGTWMKYQQAKIDKRRSTSSLATTLTWDLLPCKKTDRDQFSSQGITSCGSQKRECSWKEQLNQIATKKAQMSALSAHSIHTKVGKGNLARQSSATTTFDLFAALTCESVAKYDITHIIRISLGITSLAFTRCTFYADVIFLTSNPGCILQQSIAQKVKGFPVCG